MGGLSLGSMVSSAHSNYLDACWSVGSARDDFGAYYTHTTQLMFMLVLSGNMPNFWDMKPVPVTAETDANGKIVYVDFSKALAATTTSTGWTVETYADETDLSATSVSVSSVSVSAGSTRVAVTLSSDIAEPIIYISYNGTSIKSNSDNKAADAFSKLEVTNKITSMEPFPVNRFTDILGTMIKVQWSKEIASTSLDKTDFTIKVNGTTAVINSIEIDATDPTVVNLLIGGGVIKAATDVITLTFAGGSITGTSSAKTAKPFTNASVQNFYMNVECTIISDFDVNANLGLVAAWGGAVEWTTTDKDPLDATDKVGHFTGNGTEWGCVRAKYTDATDFMAAMNIAGVKLKGRIYVVSNSLSENIEIQLMHSTKYDYDANGRSAYISATTLGTGKWVEFEAAIQAPADQLYDAVMIRGSKASPGSDIEFYIDDLSLCPPPPTVDFVSGKVVYDGSMIEIKFSTGMKVPASNDLVTLMNGTDLLEVTKIEAKQGDATTLVFTLGTPVLSSSTTVTASASAALQSLDNRYNEAFTNKKLANLFGITVTTGWRDDFASTTDFVTANVGVAADFVGAEVATGDGYYSVTMDGSEGYNGISIMTYTNQSLAAKEVMDLTGREIVKFRYRVVGTVPSNLELRIDFKDLVNCYPAKPSYASDGMAWLKLTPSTTWKEETLDLKATLFNQYSFADIVEIDRTNIYQVLMYFISAQATAAPWEPTVFDGKIEFDYISIGSPLFLSKVTAEINENGTVKATSSADGKIYLVPEETAPMFSTLQDAVAKKLGVAVDATANIEASLIATGLKAGYYFAYAYDPAAGALSSRVGVQINDVTAPVITQFSKGDFSSGAVVSVTVNEDATVYIVPAGTLPGSYFTASVGTENVEAGVQTAITLKDGLTIGSKYVFVAQDWASPERNTSIETANPSITIVAPTLTFELDYVVDANGNLPKGNPIKITTNIAATVYLVPATVPVSTVADLTTNNVATGSTVLAAGVYSFSMPTTAVAQGNYYVYASQGTQIAGPSALVTVISTNIPLESLKVTPSTVSVPLNSSSTPLVVSYTPSDATDKALTFTYSVAGIAEAVVSTPGNIVVTGNQVGNTVITVNGADGISTTISVTVTCPTVAPIATEIPNVTGCSGTPVANLKATYASPTAVTRWFAASTGGTAIDETNDFAHGVTTGLKTLYAAKYDDACESATRLAVTVTVSASSTPVITYAGSFCEGDDATVLTATPSGGTWSGSAAIAANGLFTPASAVIGANSVTYTVAGDCGGIANKDITVNAAPAISITPVSPVCSNNAIVTLAATPPSGVWTGKGIVAGTNTFNPALATIGANQLTYTVSENNCEAAESISVTVNATPEAVIVGLPTSVCVNSDAINLTTKVSVTGGIFADNLGNVSASLFTPTIVGSSIITHTVVKDGCTGVDSKTIVVTEAPSITPVAALCTSDGAITLVATPTGGNWSGDGVSVDKFYPSIAGAGTKTITYTNGCSATTTIAVVHAEAPTVNDQSVAVNGTPLAFQATGANVSGTIRWYNAQKQLIADGPSYIPDAVVYPTSVENTVYTFYATNTENNCESNFVSATLSVSSCGLPAPTGVYSVTVCEGEAIASLTATGTNLQWYNESNVFITTGVSFDPTQYITEPGIYTFRVSQKDACESVKASTTVTVNAVPELPVGTGAEICFGATAKKISAVGTGIIWEDKDGNELSNGSEYIPTVTAVGNYTYNAVAVSTKGCKSDKVAVIYTIHETPAEPTIAPVTACEGSTSVALEASGTNITWYSSSSTFIVLQEGEAKLNVSDAEVGTTSYFATDSLGICVSERAEGKVTINAAPDVTLTKPIPTSLCVGDAEISLDDYFSPAGGTYSGDITAASVDPSVLAVGIYSVTYTVTSIDNCSTALTKEVKISDCSTKIQSIDISSTLEVPLNGYNTLSILINPPAAKLNAVSFEIGDATIVSVENGTVKGLKEGSTTIKVLAQDGSNVSSNTCTVTVSKINIPVESITITTTGVIVSDNNGTHDVSQYVQLNPDGATVQSIEYSSSDNNVVMVDPTTGKITGKTVTVGTEAKADIFVKVTSTDGSIKEAVIKVTVKKENTSTPVTSISIPVSLSLEEASTFKLTADAIKILPLNPSNKTLTWAKTSGFGGTIDAATGEITITGTAGETFKVQASATDGSGVVSNEMVITVIKEEIVIISVIPTISVGQIEVGGVATITINTSPANTTQNTFSVTASSVTTGSSVDIKEVNANTYTVTGVTGGDVSIKVTSNSNTTVYSNVSLKVIEKVSSITISNAITEVAIKQTLTLKTEVGSKTATNQLLNWTSSNEAIATVTGGVVTGVSAGTATITATAADGSGLSKSIDITVKAVEVESITTTATKIEVQQGKSSKIVFTVNPSAATDKDVTFTSSNTDFVTVDALGNVTGVSYDAATGKGVAEITITSKSNPSISAKVTVTVIPVQFDKSALKELLKQAYEIMAKSAKDPIYKESLFGSGTAGTVKYDEFLTVVSDAEAVEQDLQSSELEIADATKTLSDKIKSLGIEPVVVGGLDDKTLSLSVYPIPFTTDINVEANCTIYTVSIFNILTSTTEIIKVNQSSIFLNTDEYRSGVYLIYVETEFGNEIVKATKK
ncbi:MAG: Ig-like domain-containing protein [Bacteroidales bacterium]|nr:Ig-like domain-containing protein [Bacteroidales bacterium]